MVRPDTSNEVFLKYMCGVKVGARAVKIPTLFDYGESELRERRQGVQIGKFP